MTERTDNALTREDIKSKAREKRYEEAKRFSDWFSEKWSVVYAILILCSVVNLIFMAINETAWRSQLLSGFALFIGLALFLSAALLFAVYAIDCYIVDDYEDND